MLSGAQGIGKSTAVRKLSGIIPGFISLSLDNFYLTCTERRQLADEVHPLFSTRGPPGTHDLVQLNDVLDQLQNASPDTLTRLPVFSKKLDDRLPPEEWQEFRGRPCLILLEGWMMGALADPDARNALPLNRIEAQDVKGDWRAYQENQLAGPYAKLWSRADAFFHIHAPSFECVLNWRLQQEAETQGVLLDDLPAVRRKWVSDFILHYERLTRRMLSGQHREGAVLAMDQNRRVIYQMNGQAQVGTDN